ncbi:Glyoxylate/hydroxypyruvate reductase A [Pigmentiphaga humi]|uniref:Glyoxylate/hydroxypyruvate reductase A n=2 Tax=Pigmentiphaga humi TaxID=2478468 RepID=A0A3P4B636_9BURK|nr:glyoxylate/hydroxypyruvate reductase A [Pigmentiphaga humi]VCU71080.1 Glyoxylate/hydroxypyruvate reductase A [Pigmentiphaga humi]
MKGVETQTWLSALRTALPAARIRVWAEGDDAPADYILFWKEHPGALAPRPGVKAIFNMGAGVDALIRLHREHGDAIMRDVPIVRLEDAGMARQMAQCAAYYALRYLRRFDLYDEQARRALWQPLDAPSADTFIIGVLGAGKLGLPVARTLADMGFPVRLYSRTEKSLPGIATYAGTASLEAFATGATMLVNLLPHTPDTEGILNASLFSRMADGGYLLNLARGDHLVESDLLDALARGKLARAALDVFRTEPLPKEHPFWRHPRLDLTPHISARTLISESVAQVADKIRRSQHGEALDGLDLQRGY